MKKKILLVLALVLVVGLGFWWFQVRKNNQILFTPPKLEVSPKPLLIFSVLGDPESDLPNLKKALEISKNNGSEFVVLVGDLTHVGSKKELTEVKKILDGSGIKFFAVPGNHDIYYSKKLTKESTKYFSEIIGEPFSEALVKDVQLVFIDNSSEEEGIGQKQMDFIRQKLSLEGNSQLLIFLHQPVYHPDSRYLMGYRNDLVDKQRLALLELIKTASPSAVFSGHLHHSSKWEKWGLKFFVAGAVTSQRNWQTPRFLEVKVFKEGNLTVSEVEL